MEGMAKIGKYSKGKREGLGNSRLGAAGAKEIRKIIANLNPIGHG